MKLVFNITDALRDDIQLVPERFRLNYLIGTFMRGFQVVETKYRYAISMHLQSDNALFELGPLDLKALYERMVIEFGDVECSSEWEEKIDELYKFRNKLVHGVILNNENGMSFIKHTKEIKYKKNQWELFGKNTYETTIFPFSNEIMIDKIQKLYDAVTPIFSSVHHPVIIIHNNNEIKKKICKKELYIEINDGWMLVHDLIKDSEVFKKYPFLSKGFDCIDVHLKPM